MEANAGTKINASVNVNGQTSHDTKTIITVLLLVFLYPIGVIVMWFWPKWKAWVKILISLPILLFLFFIILLPVVLIAINPAKQFAQANNTARQSNVNAILNASNQYMRDNKGTPLTGVSATAQYISKGGADICAQLVPQYIAALPSDPLANNGTAIQDCFASYDTGFLISIDSEGRVTISAPKAELGKTISATR